MNPINEYLAIVNLFYGVYFDARTGFLAVNKILKEAKAKCIEKRKITEEEYDNHEFVYGIGGPNIPGSIALSSCKNIEHIKRNENNGLNQIILENTIIVNLYEIWENTARNKISEEFNIAREEIKSNVFGDLRLLRNSIVHNKSVALDETKKLKIFTQFKPGDDIAFGEWPFFQVIESIRQECEELKQKYNFS